MTEIDCLKALQEFSRKVRRAGETSDGIFGQKSAPHDRISVVFEVDGSFGVADDLLEAMRTLGWDKDAAP